MPHSKRTTDTNPYLYNGKGFVDDLVLNWHDYGARFYDAQIGRFHSVDPMIEKHYDYTSYAYCYNNPLLFTDPFGMDTIVGVGRSEDMAVQLDNVDVVSSKSKKPGLLQRWKNWITKIEKSIPEGEYQGKGTSIEANNRKATSFENWLMKYVDPNAVKELSGIFGENAADPSLNNTITFENENNPENKSNSVYSEKEIKTNTSPTSQIETPDSIVKWTWGFGYNSKVEEGTITYKNGTKRKANKLEIKYRNSKGSGE